MAFAAPFLRVHDTGQSLRLAPPVSRTFWSVATLFAVLLLYGTDLRGSGISFFAIALFLIGGLPHGAFDIVLARLVFQLSPARVTIVFVAYVAAAATMALVWWAMPGAALAMFLTMAAYHFGEDWTILDDRLLRTAVGAAPLAAAAFGQFEDVAVLFMAMSGQSAGSTIASLLYAMSPVILLMTSVALVIAFRRGAHMWAVAMGIALAALLALPPLLGFALYFACLHSPRHLQEIRTIVASTNVRQSFKPELWLHGACMTALALTIFASALSLFIPADGIFAPINTGAGGFILLSVLAVPHLLLSNVVSARITNRPRAEQT